MYIFKVNIVKMLSCDLAHCFENFGKLCLKAIVAKICQMQKTAAPEHWT